MDRHMKDIIIAGLLFVMIILRAIITDTVWMGIVTYSAFGVALVDLYVCIKTKYGRYSSFVRIRGIAILCSLVYVVLWALVALRVVVINSTDADILSLASLFVSIPSGLYCDLVGSYIVRYKKGK